MSPFFTKVSSKETVSSRRRLRNLTAISNMVAPFLSIWYRVNDFTTTIFNHWILEMVRYFFEFPWHMKRCLFALVTQPMMQHWPNTRELRSMDSYIQILCRFQKSKQKVPPPSLLILFFSKPTLGKNPNFFFRCDGGGTFCLHFWNLHEIWI